MKHSVYPLLAAISLGLLTRAAVAETRPHYGGSLRIELRAGLASLDPVEEGSEAARTARRNLAALIFDTLVVPGANGTAEARLAHTWQHSDDFKRWQFWLQPGVKLHDGSTLTPAQVADSLSSANPGWRVTVVGDSVTIEFDAPHLNLLSELGRSRNAIVMRKPDGLVGTGPFKITDWQPGRRVVLKVNDDYWNGRPYLDQVQIDLGRPLRTQAIDLDLGKTDVAEIAPEQVRHAMAEAEGKSSRRIVDSAPDQLLALVFISSQTDPRLREALALCLDRRALHNVILQREGEPAGSLLPQWISGYAFLFSAAPDLARARQLRSEAPTARPLVLAYDADDPLARAIAERVAVNARDVGTSLQVSGQENARAAVRLLRLPLESPDAATTLAALAAVIDTGAVPRMAGARSPEELYAAERDLLQSFRVIPLLHIPEAYGLGPQVHDWTQPQPGGWPLNNVWVEGARP